MSEERFSLNIAVAFDYNFISMAKVSLLSLKQNSTRQLKIHALVRDMSSEIKSEFEAELRPLEFSWYDMDKHEYGVIRNMLPHISSNITMDRLLLPELLPKVQRLVYLDLDSVVLGDISELFTLDLHGKPIAARPSILDSDRFGWQIILKIGRRFKQDWELNDEFIRLAARIADGPFLAFNAGVLVMDLDKLRADKFTPTTLAIVNRYGLNDQEVINLWTNTRLFALPVEWNCYADQEPIKGAKFLHYAGARKPWKENLGAIGEPWLHYADMRRVLSESDMDCNSEGGNESA